MFSSDSLPHDRSGLTEGVYIRMFLYIDCLSPLSSAMRLRRGCPDRTQLEEDKGGGGRDISEPDQLVSVVGKHLIHQYALK